MPAVRPVRDCRVERLASQLVYEQRHEQHQEGGTVGFREWDAQAVEQNQEGDDPKFDKDDP